jgi:hypothetical protein
MPFMSNLLRYLKNLKFLKDNINDLTILIDIIIKKAETKDGEKMFDLESKIKMKKFVDPDIISKVANEILGVTSSVSDLKKN